MLHVQLKKDLTIDYMKHGKVKCALYEWLKNVAWITVRHARNSKTTDDKFFNTNPESKKLSEEQVQFFYHLVAKLLYLSKCTRQDI